MTAVPQPQPPTSWPEAFKHATNDDPEIRANAKYFDCSYMLDMEDHRYVVHVHRGKVEEVVGDPGDLEEEYQFALRASADTWRKMAEPMPQPMYHGIWAATFRRDLRMDGDILVLMQNLRCLTRQVELLRETGVPV